MTVAADLVRRIREAGAELRLGGPTGVQLLRHGCVDAATIEAVRRARDDIRALLAEEAYPTSADAVHAAHRLLRDYLFEREPAPCVFHCGHANERCRRCGAPIAEHYSRPR